MNVPTHLRWLWAGALVLAAIATPASAASTIPASLNPAPTVLITGSSRGIGLELARQYAEAGWQVIATARRPAQSEGLAALGKARANVRLEALDVVDGASVAALRGRLAGQPIDVLINNAGDTDEFRGQSMGSLDHSRFGYLMELNAHGPVRVTEALLPNVLASRQKKVLAISSLAGSMGARGGGMPGGYWYKASKAALNMLVLSMAADLAPQGVLVAALSPGQVDTRGYAARGVVIPGLIDARTSVEGLRKVIEGLRPEQSGTFIRYTGETQPW